MVPDISGLDQQREGESEWREAEDGIWEQGGKGQEQVSAGKGDKEQEEH